MSPLEAQLEADLCRYAEECGFLAWKLKIEGRRGASDRLLVSPEGDMLFAEFKRPGFAAEGALSPNQRSIRLELVKRGVRYRVINDYHAGTALVRQLLRRF